MKTAVAVKDDFACRDKSKVVADVGIFGLSRFGCEEKITDLICKSISTSLKFSAETRLGRIEFQYRDEIIKIALFGKSKGQCSNARNKIDNCSIENISKTENFLIDTLIEEMKPVVIGDK